MSETQDDEVRFAGEIDGAAAARLAEGGFIIPTPAQVDEFDGLRDDDKPAVLAWWGIPSPPPVGWRSYLVGLWHWEGGVVHDTIFDDQFQARWLGIKSGIRVPLANVQTLE